MKTVKEVSELTGISVRTLHYYDEIGLLTPTAVTEAEYRLYDDKALQRLQQILFFREFDMPLKDIRTIMDDPELDRNQILEGQKKILLLKKERLERMIRSIDDILKGEDRMDFEVFSKDEIEALYQLMTDHMTEESKKIFIEYYGSMEAFHEEYVNGVASEQVQRNFQKVVEWYGDKESVMKAVKEAPKDAEIMTAYQRRLGKVWQKLADKKGTDVNSFEVKELVGEYDFVSKQLYQMKDVSKLMLELAQCYKTDAKIKEGMDSAYGEGASLYIGEAIEAFYEQQD